MTSRDIIANLLVRRPAPRYGVFDTLWPETYKEAWAADGFPQDADPCITLDYDLFPAGHAFNSEPFPGRRDVVEETDEWTVAKDGRGATLKFWKHKMGTPEHMAFEVTTPEIWETYKKPLLATDPSRVNAETVEQRIAEGRERGKFTFVSNMFVFELLRATLGDENFLPAMALEPDWIKDFCQTYLDFYIRHYELLFEQAGLPDGAWIYEDLGYKTGLFCSPSMLDDMIFPYHKQLVDYFKSKGLPVIIHSCGNVNEAVPGIIGCGYDCLEAMEAKAGMDVVELAKKYGENLSFMGNINVMTMVTNDKEKIEKEIVTKMSALKELGASYIYHSDHSVPPQVTLDTYKFILETVRKNAELQ